MSRRARRGGLLIEVLIGFAIAAGPLLISLGVIQSAVAGARFNSDRATARIALIDVTELLLGASVESLQRLARSDAADWLDTYLQERLSHLPDTAREQYEAELAPFFGRFTFQLDEKLDAHAAGLARVTLSVKIGDQSTVTVVRLFRPADREQPK